VHAALEIMNPEVAASSHSSTKRMEHTGVLLAADREA
jgi:hypothetical protein